MADVAREAGVSLSLVSLAFRDAYGVNKETRERILAVAERMNYQPNRVAARLASKTDTTLGVFLLDLHNEFFVDLFDGIREAAEKAHRELVITVGSITGQLDAPALDSLIRARVDVIVAAGLLLPDSELSGYRKRLRLVSVARAVPGFDSVCADNKVGVELALDHLVGLGHRRIVHLSNRPSDGYAERSRAFKESMNRMGLPSEVVEVDYSRREASDAIGPVLDSVERPTAILAHNDQIALGVLDAAHARGLRVPQDLSVVGFDDTSISSTPGISLTTVNLHAVELGRRATELAIQRSHDPGGEPITEWFTPTLIVRTSTAPPAA